MTESNGKSDSWVRGVVGLALAYGAACPTFAAAIVNHNFAIALQPNQVFEEVWSWRVHAEAHTLHPSCDRTPPDDFGFTEHFMPPKALEKPIAAACGGTKANAKAALNVVSAAKNNHSVEASATAVKPGPAAASAYAKSRLAYQTGVQSNPNARINWQNDWRISRTLLAHSGVTTGIDPLEITALNLDNGQVLSSRLWDSRITLSSLGSSTWQDGHVTLDGTDGEFFVALESPYITSGTGSMRLLFEGGVVTLSEDSGIFDGLLPMIGDLAQMDILVGDALGNFAIDVDFGVSSLNGFLISGSASSEASESDSVPEPGSAALAVLALVGLAINRQCQRGLATATAAV